jgi:hypothetical protein
LPAIIYKKKKKLTISRMFTWPPALYNQYVGEENRNGTVSKRKSKGLEDVSITIEIEIASKRCLGASK